MLIRFLLMNTLVLPYLVDKTISISTRIPTSGFSGIDFGESFGYEDFPRLFPSVFCLSGTPWVFIQEFVRIFYSS
jgi:hypothetical protein